jgi:hypothetical protein
LRPRVLVVVILVVGAVLATWLLQGPSDAELAVLGALHGAAEAVESGDKEALSEYIAADYRDRLGHDDQTVVRRVMRERELWGALQINFDGLEVKVEEGTGFATTSFRLDMSGDPLEAPEIRDRYDGPDGQRFRVRWRRHGDLWLVVRGEVVWRITDAI